MATSAWDLREPNIYHNSGMFYKKVGILLGGVSACEELVGVYSQEKMGVQILCRFSKTNQKTNNPGGSSLALLIAPPVLQHRIRSL